MTSRTLSIHLAKQGKTLEDCLEDDHGLTEVAGGSNLPSGTTIFLKYAKPKPPWWKAYFGVEAVVQQLSAGAVVGLPVNSRLFLLTFGTGSFKLRDDAYDHDFGAKVVLNAVDPDKLKNTDTLDPGSSRRQRVQLPFDADLTFFDFAADESILKSLTGKVKTEYSDIAKSVTGASSLRITTEVEVEHLPNLCARLLEIASRHDYLKTFPHLRAIQPISDPDEVAILDAQLCAAVFDQESGLVLTIPDIVNYSDETFVSFSGLGASPVYDDVYIKQYREYVEASGATVETLTVADLSKHKLRLLDSAHNAKRSYSIYRSLVHELASDEEGYSFHLSDGTWYKVANELLAGLRDFINARAASSTWLKDYNYKTEGEYNGRVAAEANAVLLDKKNIAPGGSTQVEPCDLLKLVGDRVELVHVKIGTTSDKLSHAFNQGANSATLLRDNAEARARLEQLIKDSGPTDLTETIEALSGDRLDVVFAVVTHRDPASGSDNLPLFSRVSLRRNIQAIERMGYQAKLVFVKDETERAGQPKKRKPRASKVTASEL